MPRSLSLPAELNQEELKRILGNLAEKLGLNSSQKEVLIENMAEHLKNQNLTRDQLADPKVIYKLVVHLVTAITLGKKDDLLKMLGKLENKNLDKALTPQQKKQLIDLLQQCIKEVRQELAKLKLTNPAPQEKRADEPDPNANLFGLDTRNAFLVCILYVIGNFSGISKMGPVYETEMSEIATPEKISDDHGDPLGLNQEAITLLVTLGADVAEELMKNPVYRPPTPQGP